MSFTPAFTKYRGSLGVHGYLRYVGVLDSPNFFQAEAVTTIQFLGREQFTFAESFVSTTPQTVALCKKLHYRELYRVRFLKSAYKSIGNKLGFDLDLFANKGVVRINPSPKILPKGWELTVDTLEDGILRQMINTPLGRFPCDTITGQVIMAIERNWEEWNEKRDETGLLSESLPHYKHELEKVLYKLLKQGQEVGVESYGGDFIRYEDNPNFGMF